MTARQCLKMKGSQSCSDNDNDLTMFQLTRGCGVTYLLQAELMLNFTDYEATKGGLPHGLHHPGS